MMNQVIHQFDDRRQMARGAAAAVLRVATEAIDARGRFVVALSGGSTPRDLYQELTNPEYRQQLDWNRIEYFWGDERTVPPDHQKSNFHMAKEYLLKPLAVDRSRIHRMEAERDDVESAAVDYAMEIANCFDVKLSDPPPRFDLILLGLGEDGHTASLFPYTHALGITDRWVVANDVPQLSTTRITITFPLIDGARAVFFLVAGDKKANALAEVLQGPDDPARLPAQMVRPAGGRLEWFVDRAAAAQLEAND